MRGRLREAVQQVVADLHLPGLSVGVVAGGETVAESAGWADIERGRPHRPGLRHRVASITKTMLALTTMALVGEGRLGPDDRVVDHLPDLALRGAAGELRVRHLLTHTGGIGEVPTEADLADPLSSIFSRRPDPLRVPEGYPAGVVVEAEPGTKWAYANHGSELLGEIVARREGAPIAEVLRRRVFEPLGMDDTDCLDHPHPDLSVGYHRPVGPRERELRAGTPWEAGEETTVDGHNVRGGYAHLRTPAAGGVQSTVPDLLRYVAALLEGGPPLVPEGVLAGMLRPRWAPHPRLDSMGLGFFLQERLGQRCYGHGGLLIGGWTTALRVFPDLGVGVVLFVNASLGLDHQELAGRTERRVLEAVLGPGPPLPGPSRIELRVLRAAPGRYRPSQPGPLTNFRPDFELGGEVEVVRAGEGLALRAARGPLAEGVGLRPIDPQDPTVFSLEIGSGPGPRAAFGSGDGEPARTLHLDQLISLVRAGSG